MRSLMKYHKNTLYIIGNGFDLHHGIPSAYRNFGEYLREHDHDIHKSIVEYLHADDDDFWGNFEENLAHLDKDQLIEDASQFLVSYSAEEWRDAYHHDYQYEIEQVVQRLSKKLHKRFKDWVNLLPIPSPDTYKNKLIKLDQNALYLNFNYTTTLENLYQIDEDFIWYIHGKSTDVNLVLGHAWKEDENNEEEIFEDPDSVDMRVQQGDKIIKTYFTSTFKPSEKIVSENLEKFDKLTDINQIYILGHSISDVDMLYFLEIVKKIDRARVIWKVSYYEDSTAIRRQMAKLDIPSHLVEYLELSDLVL